MPAFAPTDWAASDTVLVQKARPWGAQTSRMVVAQQTLRSVGASLLTYPSGGMPMPPPAFFGFRESIDYAIPMGPFFPVSNTGTAIPYLVVPTPTGTGSGAGAVTDPVRLRFMVLGPTTQSGPSSGNEMATGLTHVVITATTNTAGLRTFMMVVGK